MGSGPSLGPREKHLKDSNTGECGGAWFICIEIESVPGFLMSHHAMETVQRCLEQEQDKNQCPEPLLHTTVQSFRSCRWLLGVSVCISVAEPVPAIVHQALSWNLCVELTRPGAMRLLEPRGQLSAPCECTSQTGESLLVLLEATPCVVGSVTARQHVLGHVLP